MTAGDISLYDIKHYKPTFRLHELEVIWTVISMIPVCCLLPRIMKIPRFLNSVDSGVNM